MRTALTAALALALAIPAQAGDAPLRAGAEAVRDRALADPTAYAFVQSLTREVGPRLAGTETSAKARDWAVARLTALGFSNVRAEAFAITSWVRGAERAEVTAPTRRRLSILGLGGSVATPPDGIEAEAVVFPTYADMLAQPPGALAGRIAVVTQPMARTQDGSGYGAVSPMRQYGPREAARRGAVAFLLRSLSTAEDGAPHTGATFYAADVAKIPAAALSPRDAAWLERAAAAGRPLRLRLSLASISAPATAWTVLGDIPGSERAAETIIVGGHLDSWDVATGATDDGAGMAITVAAARLAGGERPKRTITVVLWGGEESDVSDAAFGAAHRAEAGQVVLIGEADNGADRVWSVRLPPRGAALAPMKTFAAAVAPLRVFVSPDPAPYGGADTFEMMKAGVPVVSVRQDVSRYFDWHHSANDTLDKIDRAQLNQAVAVWAALIYVVANSDVDFRAAAPKPTAP